ncbi:MAG TPA: hydrolase [Candidatus Limnocylindria bacterium]|nr:hydrolase [Candidatus Limnocylindria bacterium]
MTEAAYVCVTCGVQQALSRSAPARCPICEDERQYVRQGGQAWTTIDELLAQGHRIELRDLEPGLMGVGVAPAVGIGQRALLVRTPAGNFLWDCVGYIDANAVERVRAFGGLAGVAFSHPHFYGVMVEWSRAFGSCPMWIPSADREWVQRDDPAIVEWSGEREVLPGLTLIQAGGHFEGSAVLHWASGADGRGALLVGDTITVVPDVRAVSFMRSYPNLIPLPADEIRRIVAAVRPYAFDRIYGGWWDRVTARDGKGAIERSARRYLKWIGAEERG